MRLYFVLAFLGLVTAMNEDPGSNPWVDIKFCDKHKAKVIARELYVVSSVFARASRRINDLVKRFETYRDGSLPSWELWTAEEASTYSTYANFIQPSPLMQGQIFSPFDEPWQSFAPDSLTRTQRLLTIMTTEYLKPFTGRSGYPKLNGLQITCSDEWVDRIEYSRWRSNDPGAAIKVSSWVDDRVLNPPSLPKLWPVTLDRGVDEQPLLSRLNVHKRYWAAVWWSNLRPQYTNVLAIWNSSWDVWDPQPDYEPIPDPLSKPMMFSSQFEPERVPPGAVHLTQIGRNDLAFTLIRWMLYMGLNTTSRPRKRLYFNQTGISMIQEETETSGGLLNLLYGNPDYPGADPHNPPDWLESMNYFYEESSERNDMNVGFLVLALFFLGTDWSRGVNQPIERLVQAEPLMEQSPFTDLLYVLYVQRPAIREALRHDPFYSTPYEPSDTTGFNLDDTPDENDDSGSWHTHSSDDEDEVRPLGSNGSDNGNES